MEPSLEAPRSEGRNWVADSWCDSERAGRFALRAAETPDAVLGEWPRSDERELALVLASWDAAPVPWPRAERTALLARAARAASADAEAAQGCARRLGLDAEEWAPHREALLGLAGTPGAELPGGEEEGIAVVAPGWGELLLGAFRRVARELAAGRRVLLFGDPELPFVADALVRAFVGEGLPPGRLALLHGAPDALVAAALDDERARALSAGGAAERVLALRRAASARRIPVQRLAVGRAGARELDPREDPERAAAEVVVAAFGRGETLSGQLDGALARVFCPERSFSRFSAALLAALEGSPDAARPLRFVTREKALTAERARTLGLDEGATLIFGEEARGAGAARARPAVLTNVEPGMECARRGEPLPVVCLLRGR